MIIACSQIQMWTFEYKKRGPVRLTQSTSGLGKRQAPKSLVVGSDTWLWAQIPRAEKNSASKFKKVIETIGIPCGVYNGMSCQTVK